MKIQKQPTLADSICDSRARKVKKIFFTQINTLIDWEKISKIIDKDYSRVKALQESQVMMNGYYLKCVYYKAGMG